MIWVTSDGLAVWVRRLAFFLCVAGGIESDQSGGFVKWGSFPSYS